MTATTNTDVLIMLAYIAAALRRPFVKAWNASASERNPG